MPQKKPAIVLMSPKGPANVGGIARLMGNFGLSDLRIVAPRCDLTSDDCKKMSLRAYPLIQNAKISDTFEEAVSDLRYLVALSMRVSSEQSPNMCLDDLFKDEPMPSENWAFVFGREDDGLRNEELRLCNLQVSISSLPEIPSINLTSSAAICLYHWFSLQKVAPSRQKTDREPLPKHEDVEVFFYGLKNLMTTIDFLKLGKKNHIIEDLRDMYNRADIRERDLRILFGILSDLGRYTKHRFFD